MSRIFFITGSSRGLGRALAEAVLAAGHRAVLTARHRDSVAALAARYPDTALAVSLDVTDPAAARAAVAAGLERFGALDVVITNAGFSDIASIEDTPLDRLHAVIDTNLWGVVNVVKAALPAMRERGTGRFIQISSVSGRLAPAPGLGAYVTAKFAAEGFLEALALEVAPFGLAVTIIEPGAMATTLASSMSTPVPSAPYAAMLSPMLSAYAPAGASFGTTPGAAADFVLAVAGLEQPPLHLPLGPEAFEYIRGSEQRRLAELDRWEKLSRSAGS